MKNIITGLLFSLITTLSWGQFDTLRCDFEVTDTLKYVWNKSNTPVSLSINTINETASGAPDDGYKAYGQLFEAPDSVTLKGFCFYGYMFSGIEDTAIVKIYQTDMTGAIDSLIDSTSVPIPLKLNYNGDLYSDSIKICVDLDTAHYLLGDYVITIENNSSSDMYLVRNATGEGNAEDLSYSYYYWDSNHAYDGWNRNYGTFGTAWDFDIIIEPIVSYGITTQHLVSQNSGCFGDTLRISSEIEYNDSLMYNRMYNPNYASYADTSSFIYIYGDDTITTDTSHVYAASGAYNAMFVGATNFSGWTFNSYNAFCSYNASAYSFAINLGNDTILCDDSLVITGGQYFDSYLWSTTDTTDLLTLYSDSLSDGVNEISLITYFQGCESYDTILVTVNELNIDLGNDTTLCLNQQLTIGGDVPGDYNWNSGQLTDSILIGPFNTSDSLFYNVEVDFNGCIGRDSIVVFIDNCLGIEEFSANISVYPNPAKDYITVSETLNEEVSLIITDLNGKIILIEDIIEGQKINISSLVSGSYILSLKSNKINHQQMLQIIK